MLQFGASIRKKSRPNIKLLFNEVGLKLCSENILVKAQESVNSQPFPAVFMLSYSSEFHVQVVFFKLRMHQTTFYISTKVFGSVIVIIMQQHASILLHTTVCFLFYPNVKYCKQKLQF